MLEMLPSYLFCLFILFVLLCGWLLCFVFGLFVILSFLFSELRMEPRALCLLGKCSTTELNPQPHPNPHLFFFFLPACMSWNTFMPGTQGGTKREHQVPWNWSYRVEGFEALLGCWIWNPGSGEELLVLFPPLRLLALSSGHKPSHHNGFTPVHWFPKNF